MQVRVVPHRPIPGILPNNKWIDEVMDMDLNKSEIARCMQYGNVYLNGKNIDTTLLQTLKNDPPVQVKVVKKQLTQKSKTRRMGIPVMADFKPKTVETPVVEAVEEIIEETPVSAVEPVETVVEEIKEEVIEEVVETVEESVEEETVVEDKLFNVNVNRDEEYVTIEVQYNSEELEGNLYGLFTVLGNRPASLEYNTEEDTWNKFSTKFANFNTVDKDSKFVFRFVANEETSLKFRISIKEANKVLAEVEEEVNF